MAKSKKHKKKRVAKRKNSARATNSNGPLLWFGKDGVGVDYSVPALALAVADHSFVKALYDAHVDGFMYQLTGERRPPFVALICRNPESARAAFGIFHDWSEASDGDAVQLTWVFHKNGTYTVFLRPDVARLSYRCIGFERFLEPVLFLPNYSKPIDQIGEATRLFREYCADWYHPFYFGAIAQDATGQWVPVVTPLLKYQAQIYDEDALPSDSIEYLALTVKASTRRWGTREKQKPSPQLRNQILDQHFPVTMQRIRRLPVCSVVEALVSRGFDASLVRQATANLVLSSTLCNGRLHFDGLRPRDAHKMIVSGVSQYFETADSGDVSSILTYENVSKQTELDCNAFLKATTNKIGHSTEEILALLMKNAAPES